MLLVVVNKIHVARRTANEQLVPGQHVAVNIYVDGNMLLLMLLGNMLPWCKRGLRVKECLTQESKSIIMIPVNVCINSIFCHFLHFMRLGILCCAFITFLFV